MQTPAGYEVIDGRFYPTDWLQVIFNPSFLSRLAHTVVAFFITTSFVVLGVGAYLHEARAVRRGRPHHAVDGAVAADGLGAAADSSSGTIMGSTRWSTSPRNSRQSKRAGRPDAACRSTLFAIPDAKAEKNRFAIEIPLLGSLILTHDLDGEVKGLKDFPADQRPPVAIPFFAFRIMVGLRRRDARRRAAGRMASLARRLGCLRLRCFFCSAS